MKTPLIAAMLAAVVVAGPSAQITTIPGQMRTETATIEAIERGSRQLTLLDKKGVSTLLTVPKEVSRFDAMKVGDIITVKYYDNVIVRVKAPGEKDVDKDTASIVPGASERPGGTAATQRTLTATITNIDAKVPSITFKGPNNWTYSSRVEDKDALKKFKAGDKVDITWTEALLISVEEPGTKNGAKKK
jgi:hypothetical protein